jgi:hypothetical protein
LILFLIHFILVHVSASFLYGILFLHERFPVYKRCSVNSKPKLLHYRNGSLIGFN